jgi:T-complex protein 1 subunit theta
VVIVAAELLIKAENLLRLGLHPAEVVEGYEKAYKVASELIEGKLSSTSQSINS